MQQSIKIFLLMHTIHVILWFYNYNNIMLIARLQAWYFEAYTLSYCLIQSVLFPNEHNYGYVRIPYS